MRVRTALPVPLAAALLLPLAVLVGPAAHADGGGPRLVPGDRAVLRGSGVQARSVVGERRHPALRARGARTAATGARFVVTYTGFSPTQRDAFQLAVDTWSRLVSSSVPIRVDARLDPLPDGVLGSAGPTDYVVQDADGKYGPEDTLVPVALANARAGRDLDPEGPDVSAEFSDDTTLFSYGAQPASGRYDFTTVVLHEIAHGLGFTGAMDVLPDSAGTERGYWDPGTSQPRPLPFDRQTVTPAGEGAVTPLLGLQRGSVRLAQALTSGRAQWSGPAGTAANGGTRPELYTPPTWEAGSSYTHLDEATYPTGDPESLMTPTLDLGELVRDPGAVSLGMLSDLGWGSDPAPLRLTGPLAARSGTTVTVTGAAAPGSTVELFFKRRGSTQTSPGAEPGFVLARRLQVGADAAFATTYAATDDHRYYARVGTRTSQSVLTQVRPVLTGPSTRSVARGASVTVAGRGLPSTTLTLRFTRGTALVATRTVAVRADGTWSRTQVVTGDLRVAAQGANGQRGETTVLLQVR